MFNIFYSQMIDKRLDQLTERFDVITKESEQRFEELDKCHKILDNMMYKEVLSEEDKITVALMMEKCEVIVKECNEAEKELDTLGREIETLRVMVKINQ